MISSNKSEPKEAFHYKPPDEELKKKYHNIFEIKKPLQRRFFKYLFDKLVATLVLLIISPFMLCLKLLYVIEGLVIPEHKGPMFFSYRAVSTGKVFKKYKNP